MLNLHRAARTLSVITGTGVKHLYSVTPHEIIKMYRARRAANVVTLLLAIVLLIITAIMAMVIGPNVTAASLLAVLGILLTGIGVLYLHFYVNDRLFVPIAYVYNQMMGFDTRPS